MKENYHVIAIRGCEVKPGFDEETANSMARGMLKQYPGYSVIVCKWVRKFELEPKITVEELEIGCKYTE